MTQYRRHAVVVSLSSGLLRICVSTGRPTENYLTHLLSRRLSSLRSLLSYGYPRWFRRGSLLDGLRSGLLSFLRAHHRLRINKWSDDNQECQRRTRRPDLLSGSLRGRRLLLLSGRRFRLGGSRFCFRWCSLRGCRLCRGGLRLRLCRSAASLGLGSLRCSSRGLLSHWLGFSCRCLLRRRTRLSHGLRRRQRVKIKRRRT